MAHTPEHAPTRPEHEHNPAELEATRAAHQERLREQHEAKVERSKEASVETARAEVESAVAEVQPEPTTVEQTRPERRRGMISKKEKDISYNATMRDIEGHMTPTSRAFSRLIHHKTVERVSDTVGSTVARPNAILAGAIAAFVISLSTLLIAKHYGYRLSGFEAIAAFAVGWLLGILYDFFRVMITGKR